MLEKSPQNRLGAGVFGWDDVKDPASALISAGILAECVPCGRSMTSSPGPEM